MKLNFLAIAGAMLIAFGVLGMASVASAGSVADTDGDLVPDAFDNCSQVPNGPNNQSNQVDTDNDGFGNICDCDFDQDNFVLGGDIVEIFGQFGGTSALHDLDGDGQVLGSDIVLCFGQFGGPPGPGAI